MATHSIAFYEEQFKVHVMQKITGENTNNLNDLLNQLISEYEEDTQTINYAYLNVKKELVG